MPVSFTPIPYSSPDIASNIFNVRWREDGAWLIAANGTALVSFERIGTTDAFNNGRKDTGLGSGAYSVPVFRTAFPGKADVCLFNASDWLYYLSHDGTKYVYTSPNGVMQLFAGANDSDISPDGQHACLPVNGNIYVIDLDQGSGGPGGINNSPLIWNFGGGTWYGARYSPDGQFLAMAQNSSGLKVYQRTGDTYTACTIVGVSGGYDGSIEWSPDGNQILVGSRAAVSGFTVYNRSGTTFTRDTTARGPAGACTARFVGEDRAHVLAITSQAATAAKFYEWAAGAFTEITLPTSLAAAHVIEVCKADPGLIALGHAGAPYMSVFRVSEPQPTDADGLLVAPKATVTAVAVAGYDNGTVEYGVKSRPGVVNIRAEGGSLTQEIPNYRVVTGTMRPRAAKIVDAIGFQGYGVMPSIISPLAARLVDSEFAFPLAVTGELAAPGAITIGEFQLAAVTIDDVIDAGLPTIEASATMRNKVNGELLAPKATATGGAGWPQDADGLLLAPKAITIGLAVPPYDFSGEMSAPLPTSDGRVLVGVRAFYGVARAPNPILITEIEVPYTFTGMLVAPKATVSGEYNRNFKVTAELIAPKARSAGEFVQPGITGLLLAPKAILASGEIRRTIRVNAIMRAPKARTIATSKTKAYVESGLLVAPKARFIGTWRAYYEINGLLRARLPRMISQSGTSDKAVMAPTLLFGEDPFAVGGGATFIFGNFNIG